MTILRTINALEETPRNTLALMFALSSHLGGHDGAIYDIWTATQNAVLGIGYFYTDIQDQVCTDCCPPGQN